MLHGAATVAGACRKPVLSLLSLLACQPARPAPVLPLGHSNPKCFPTCKQYSLPKKLTVILARFRHSSGKWAYQMLALKQARKSHFPSVGPEKPLLAAVGGVPLSAPVWSWGGLGLAEISEVTTQQLQVRDPEAQARVAKA